MRRIVLRLIVPLLFIAAAIPSAAPAAPDYFWPDAVDVAIFKNGCAYIVREGEVEPGPDGVLTAAVPRPILGTLDVYSLTKGVEVREVVAFYDQTTVETEIKDVQSFYQRQIGNMVMIEYGEEKLEGVLRAVLAPAHLLIETGGQTILVPIAAVQKFAVTDEAGLTTTGEGRQPRFRIVLSGKARRIRLGLSYIEQSWAWFPTYRVNLLPDGQAEVVLTATVVNNGEDIKGATLHLIVGVPNLIMQGTISPMALDVNTGTVGMSRLASAPSQVFDNALMAEGDMEQRAAGYSENVAGGAVEDLFVYEKKKFSLGRGQRMQLELFRGRVPCVSGYKWTVPIDQARTYNSSQLQNQAKLGGEWSSEVWHYYRLTNKTVVPWTTGPALIVSGWQPVAQDLMKYTQIGAEHDLRGTVAPEIRGTAVEEEIDRRVVRIYNNDDYLRITVRGTLTLESYRKEKSRVEVAKEFWGAVKETGGADETKLPEYLWNVNPRTRLEWTVELPAGEKKTVKYTYEFLINI